MEISLVFHSYFLNFVSDFQAQQNGSKTEIQKQHQSVSSSSSSFSSSRSFSNSSSFTESNSNGTEGEALSSDFDSDANKSAKIGSAVSNLKHRLRIDGMTGNRLNGSSLNVRPIVDGLQPPPQNANTIDGVASNAAFRVNKHQQKETKVSITQTNGLKKAKASGFNF